MISVLKNPMNKPFFISTSIPYVNVQPHIGHALEYVQTDAIARYRRLLGDDVFFLTGTDENSLKNVQAAEKAGKEVKAYVDDMVTHFTSLRDSLNIQYDEFIRTTEDRHFAGSQKVWSLLKPEDLEKRAYEGLYCVGCESFYKEEDLIDGNCPEHKKPPEVVKEENWFFKLSNYQDELKQYIESGALNVVPGFRKNEWLAFLERGLEDFSVSRSHERARGWGVPVPGDEEQIMYVWVDALSNYITALDFATDGEQYKKYWVQGDDRDVVHAIGKGIGKFHVLYWPALLLSAGIPLPTKVFIHGYLTVEGNKIGKSLGNAIAPTEVVEKYGIDPVRYYLLGAVSPVQDGDWSTERFEEFYTAHLANGLGNLTSRVLTMVEKYADSTIPQGTESHDASGFWNAYKEGLAAFKFDDVVALTQGYVSKLDGLINDTKPWEKAKAGEDISDLLYTLAESLRMLAVAHLPIIPEAAEKILAQLGIDASKLESLDVESQWGRLAPGTKISKGEALFPRLEK